MRLWNQCDECGRFVSYADLETGNALHRLLEPDSDLGGEKWETLCPLHMTAVDIMNNALLKIGAIGAAHNGT